MFLFFLFITQVVAAFSMIYLSNLFIHTIGTTLFGYSLTLGVLAVPLTLFCTVGVIDAINMIDGFDTLAGGISLIAFISFAFLAYVNNQPAFVILSAALCGAALGFLKYNSFTSRLFMGDSGSLFLGFSLTFLALAITQKENSLVSPVLPLLILAVPIIDTIVV